jgi:hypothetical protein
MALATTVCSLLSLTVGCTLGYSVATYRRSTVSDLKHDARQQSNWIDGPSTCRQVTKSQLIAVLNERNMTDVCHDVSRLYYDKAISRHEPTLYGQSSIDR